MSSRTSSHMPKSSSTTSNRHSNLPSVCNLAASTSSTSPASHIHAPAVTNTTTKKHGFGLGLGRFSLRRIFSPGATLGRPLANISNSNSNGKHRKAATTVSNASSMKDNRSESGSNYDNKSISNTKIGTYRATCSLSDAESFSISSARSDYHYQSTGPAMVENNIMTNSGLIECPLCLLEQPTSHFPELTLCSHRACYHCLQSYLKIEILESRVNVHCPECTEAIHPNDIQKILNDDTNIIEKYESFMLRRILLTEPDARWCPAPDCCYVVIANGCASCPKLKCDRPGCETSFCYHCKQEWHPNQTCDAARAQRRSKHNHKSSSVSFSHDSIIQRDDIKPCPCCKVPIIKMDDGSCNHMTCSVCGTEFCWLCMKEISDLHYLSPSGCTFWGKKPWSRKKKIMWQLGMLVGAPVGIALIAGIAVPAIIIGIPVWVGRKLHARFERHQMSRHKRNILVTTGVVTSILVSPILAAVAVGIGVPILLAYVYGVVPISLCRSGGCGVTTTASGVRIELDEENEIGISSNQAPDGVSVDTALSLNNRVNPSIGEVSLGMSASISMGSGSHLDRLAAVDRENSSIAACAGSIASGNISIGVASTSISQRDDHKAIDGQTDVSSNKRFSLSSHSETASATLSFGDRSMNMSLMDDASVKALAGSIVGYKDATYINSSSATPGENKSNIHECCCDEHEFNSHNQDSISNNISYIDCCASSSHAQPSSPSYQPSSSIKYENCTQSGLKHEEKQHNSISKFESRSLEHLSNCDGVCAKKHRPCCPNHVHNVLPSTQLNTCVSTTSSQSEKRSKSKMTTNSNHSKENHENERKASSGSSSKRHHHNHNHHNHQQQQQQQQQPQMYIKHRTSSVKSNVDSQKELKRFHSTEYNVGNHSSSTPSYKHQQVRKSSVPVNVFRSTSTSPNDVTNEEYPNVAEKQNEKQKYNDKRERAYSNSNQLGTQNNLKYQSNIKQKKSKSADAKEGSSGSSGSPHVSLNMNDYYQVSLKSSQV